MFFFLWAGARLIKKNDKKKKSINYYKREKEEKRVVIEGMRGKQALVLSQLALFCIAVTVLVFTVLIYTNKNKNNHEKDTETPLHAADESESGLAESMIMRALFVAKTSAKKVRLGSAFDGGYVILDEIGGYDALFSAGVSNDVNFENDFLKKFAHIPCFAFDGTVGKLPDGSHTNIQFFKKNIAATNSPATTNLVLELEPFRDIFLKMDIEGHEYPFFLSMPLAVRRKLKQIVVEVHTPCVYGGQFDLGWTISQKLEIMLRLADTHVLAHFHANNNNGTSQFKGVAVPDVFELTYVRKGEVEILGQNDDPIPGPLDAPCNTLRPDIPLNYMPFFHAV